MIFLKEFKVRNMAHSRCIVAMVIGFAVSCMSCAQSPQIPSIRQPSFKFTHPEIVSHVAKLTTSGEDEFYPDISPDGQKVAFVTFTKSFAGEPPNSEVCVMDCDGGPRFVVTQSKSDENRPDWFPDGENLLFDTDRMDGLNLWKKDAMGTEGSTRLTTAYMPSFDGVVSPDGSKIAFTGGEGSSPSELTGGKIYLTQNQATIWLMNTDGAELLQLTEGMNPAWSPDGMTIAFARKVSGRFNIWTMHFDGTGLTELYGSSGNDIQPCWSPSGSQLVFASDQAGSWDIWKINTDGTNLIRLIEAASDEGSPCWGERGNIYFHSSVSGNWDICKMRVLPFSAL